MALFEHSIKAVFHHEGGYVQDTDDPGGATNMGITHKTLASWRKVSFVTPEEVQAMTKEEAGEIYKASYWDKMRLDEFSSQALAEAVMDFGVNAGTRASIKLLQEAVNWAQRGDTLTVDGTIGPSTMHEVNTTPDREVIQKFFELRIRYYAAICRRRRASRKFLYAWTRRSLDHV